MTAYFQSGTSKLKAGLIKEAIEDFEIADEKNASIMNERDSSKPGILDGLGQCYHALKVYDKALEYYASALKMEPKRVDFLKNRSKTYYDLKQYDDSAKDLDKALQ